MHINALVVKALQKEYSLDRYAVRAAKDSCLHDDVEKFVSRHDVCSSALLDKLLDNHFEALRRSDPEYPA
jgi:hypothetical protein